MSTLEEEWEAATPIKRRPPSASPGAAPPAAPAPDKAAPGPAPESPGLLRRAAQAFGEIGQGAAQSFGNMVKGALGANDFAARAILHPRETFKNPGAVVREGMRGVNSNIPFGGKLASLASGQPEQSPEDAAAAPGAQDLGGVAGLPVGNMVGGIAGKAVETAVPAVARAVRGVGAAASERMTGRAVEDLGVGAGKSARKGLEAKADEIGEALAERPELRKAAAVHAATGDAKMLTREAKALAADGQKTLETVYADAAKPGYRPPNYTGEAGAAPGVGEVGGVPVPSIKAKLDERIATLRTGNQTENDTADALEAIRNKLHARIGTEGVVDPKKLRHEQSGYQGQGKYGKGSASESVVAQANQEAAEAVGDALLEHVTGMDYKGALADAAANPDGLAAKVVKANGQITAAMRIEKAIEGRAGSNPGAPNRLTALAHGMKHFGSLGTATAATGLGHGAVGAAIMAADLAHTMAPAVARRLDPAIVKLVERARAEKWSGAQLAKAISGAAPKANAAGNLEGGR